MRQRKENPLTAPVNVLLLSSSGNLTVHTDMEDHSTYEFHKPPKASDGKDKDELTSDKPRAKRARRQSKPLGIRAFPPGPHPSDRLSIAMHLAIA